METQHQKNTEDLEEDTDFNFLVYTNSFYDNFKNRDKKLLGDDKDNDDSHQDNILSRNSDGNYFSSKK